MWLRNFDLFCAASQVGEGKQLPAEQSASAGEDGYNRVRTRQGGWQTPTGTTSSYNQYFPAKLYFADLMKSVSAGLSTTGICLGTGTTPATYDDYNLESYLDTQFQYATYTDALSYDAEKKVFVRTVAVDFLNISSGDVTVTEVGLGGWYNMGGYESFLLMREVLETPATVASGEYLRVKIAYDVGAYPNKPTVTASAI